MIVSGASVNVRPKFWNVIVNKKAYDLGVSLEVAKITTIKSGE